MRWTLHSLQTALLACAMALGWAGATFGQSGATDDPAQAKDEDAVFLVAHPSFRDASYDHTVLIAAPIPNGGHVGVIINRPTNRTLFSLFPEHEPSKLVREPVHYGGPFSPSALVAVVRADASPGPGTLPLMRHLYIAFRATTIDQVIEKTPNEARYYVGYVGWRPGELKAEIDRGLWAVLRANPDTLFQKDLSSLWEDLIAQSRQLQAALSSGGGFRRPPYPPAALY